MGGGGGKDKGGKQGHALTRHGQWSDKCKASLGQAAAWRAWCMALQRARRPWVSEHGAKSSCRRRLLLKAPEIKSRCLESAAEPHSHEVEGGGRKQDIDGSGWWHPLPNCSSAEPKTHRCDPLPRRLPTPLGNLGSSRRSLEQPSEETTNKLLL